MTRRRLLNLLTVLSLLLCAAVVGLWVQSILWPVWVGRWAVKPQGTAVTSAEVQAHSAAGGLSVRYVRKSESASGFVIENRTEPFDGVRWRMEYPGDDYPYWDGGIAGVEIADAKGLQWMRQWGTTDVTALTLPYWLLLATAAGAPFLQLIARTRQRRRASRAREESRCPKCGYDLRATPGRCPECGRVEV